MQCPVCDHQAAAADFGEPLRCPNCRAFYEKAVIAQALKADSGSSPKQPTAPVAGVWSDQGRIVSGQSKIIRWIGMSVSALIGIGFYISLFVAPSDSPKSAPQRHCSESAAYRAAQSILKKHLRSPASAVFAGEGKGGAKINELGDCKFRVKSFVDSQNAFGAMLRTEFRITVEALPDGDTWQGSDMKME